LATGGGFIRGGYSGDLDRLRDLAAGGKQWIAKYQADQIAATGIPNLKVAYNKVFGYYIEITNAHKDKTPAHYLRKQTTVNAERYITPDLKQYEEQVLTADERAQELEHELFVQLRSAVQHQAKRLAATAAALAQLDVLCALAELARARGYVRPTVCAEPVLQIRDGRHPVLDLTEAAGTFVPNDAACGGDDGVVLLITGPNMAGKSTYIRQVALLAILAQMGSFVPAREATIGIADRIFARVGASDELSRGQSTFMVEMTETARILNTATPRSLVVLDEIGRGTSTYDGISLAWAIVEHLHDEVGCRTLFATHYHELTDLAGTLSGVRNLNVAVKEWQDHVVFLHKIVPGAADKSYGIHVARLAGVPRGVNERAKQILAQLEAEHLDREGRPKIAVKGNRGRRGDLQLTLFAPPEHPVVEELRQLDVNSLTPLEALAKLAELQQTVGRAFSPSAKPR
jgi:DNA mismatch repair protein MutS